MSQSAYEVFVKTVKDSSFMHVGSVRAPSPEFALEWAQASYTRRSDAQNLWVVPRECITEMPAETTELLRADQRKEYRQPAYFTRRKKELFRQVQSLADTPDTPPATEEKTGNVAS